MSNFEEIYTNFKHDVEHYQKMSPMCKGDEEWAERKALQNVINNTLSNVEKALCGNKEHQDHIRSDINQFKEIGYHHSSRRVRVGTL